MSVLLDTLSGLQNLRPSELDQVSRAVDTLLKTKARQEPATELYALLVLVSKALGVEFPPYHRLKPEAKTEARKAAKALDLFLAPYRLTKIEKVNALQLICRTAINNILSYRGQVYASSVIRTLKSPAAILSTQFPGYTELGLLHLVFKRKARVARIRPRIVI